MPMIGAKSAASYDPSQLSKADKLMLLGATLRDVGGAIRGDQSDAVMQAQAALGQRATLAKRAALMQSLGGLMGGELESTADRVNAPQIGQVPQMLATRAPVPLSDPRWAQAALAAPELGVDLGPLLRIQEMNKAKPPAPINTAHGIYSFDPQSNSVTALKEFQAPPTAPSVDRVIGTVLDKAMRGEKLSPAEQKIYNRWNNGTPAKTGGGAAASGLPAGFVLD